jgi:hypothetical protein
MKIHKLNIQDFNEIDYNLIAIHTTLEDYHLAFLINSQLKISLKKDKEEVISNTDAVEVAYSKFSFEDEKCGLFWSLIQNQKWIEAEQAQDGFFVFEEPQKKKVFLIPEFKNVDYFLKIEEMETEDEAVEISNKIQEIEKVTAAFVIDIERIKSKNHLIF